MVFFSLIGPGFTFAHTDALVLDTTVMLPMHAGTQGAAGVSKLTVPIAKNAAFQPWNFAMQGLSARNGAFGLTNPVIVGQR